jgi:hypothetical protein
MSQDPPNSPDERSTRSRYPGPRPFEDSIDDYIRFYGRRGESEELYLRVLSVPLLVQFGKSGLGKTSLLQAGLFPLLRKKAFLPVMVRLDEQGKSLTFAIADAIKRAIKTPGLELTEGRTDGLWELLLTTAVWRDDLLLTPVLVLDQFEEVFTLRDAMFRAELAAELGALATGVPPERLRAAGIPQQFSARPDVKIVISLREDYLGALQEFSAAIPSLFHERLRLEPLTEKGACEAITEPAKLEAAVGEESYWAPPFEFEKAALESLINFLKGKFGEIEPFQLQLECRHIERIAFSKQRKPGDRVTITLSDFTGSQDFASVLKNFYQHTLDKLPRLQKKRAEELCAEGLLNASGHRSMREEGEIQKEFRIEKNTLDILVKERLVRCEPRHESVYYEISHDRLADSIFASKRFRFPKKVRRALWTAGIVVPIILGILGYSLIKVNAARKDAEELSGFLLGESFLGEIRDAGRGTMLEQVRDKTQAYLSDRRRHKAYLDGLALRNNGDIERTQGHLAQSVKLFNEALNVFESSPDSPDSRQEAARTHERLGEALSDQGQVIEALSHYDAARKNWLQLVSNAPTANNCASLAGALVFASELRVRTGNTKGALAGLEDALRITTAILFGRQKRDDQCGGGVTLAEPYPDPKTLEVFSQAILLRAQVLQLKEDYDGPAALALEARRLKPHSVSARKNASVALAWRGNGRFYDQSQLALEDYRESMRDFEELRRWDPNNRLWQRERAATQLLIARALGVCDESKSRACKPISSLEAEAMSLDAIATLAGLTEIDPTNVSLQRDLSWALQTHAGILRAQGRHDERLARLQYAERLYGNSKPDVADLEYSEKLAQLLVDKSEALLSLNQVQEAKKTMQRSIDEFAKLIAADKVNPNFVIELSDTRKKEGKLRRKLGDTAGADAAEREAKRLEEQYENPGEKSAKEKRETYIKNVNEGAKLYKQQEYTAALREFRAAESDTRDYIRLRPSDFVGYNDLRNNYEWIRLTQEKLGTANDRAVELSATMQAAVIATLLAPEGPKTEMNTNLLQARRRLAIFLNDQGKFAEALAMAQEVMIVAEGLVLGAPKNAQYLWNLGNASAGVGMVQRNLKKEGWEEAIRSGLIHIQKAAEIEKTNSAYRKELGDWRKYLADELTKESHKKGAVDEVLKEKASVEYRLALKGYQESARLKPADMDVQQAIRELSKLEVR